ncbi:SPOR domain-containing protein [Hazenella coriacea]|nr:SPOR domain-containing protein [Hazenella coriacea]
MKVVVKSKNQTTSHQAKNQPQTLYLDSAHSASQPNKDSIHQSKDNSGDSSRFKDFTDAKEHYQFKKVFQMDDSMNKEVIEWASPHNPFSKQRRKQRKPNASGAVQLLIAIGGAIIVGTIMGFSILSLFFSDDSSHSDRSIDAHLPPKQVTKTNQESPGTSTRVKTGKLVFPELKTVMIQAGNFSEKTGAQKTVQTYRTQGLAAVMSEQSPYRIFLGMGLSRDEALKLSAIYQEKDIPVYLKELNISGATPSLPYEVSVQLPQALQQGNRIFIELGQASVQEIQVRSQQAQTPFKFKEEWLEQHKKFVTEIQMVENLLPVEAQESLTGMSRALDQAIQSGQEAKNNPSQALLWQIQEGLVRYAISYDQLVKSLTK